MLPQCFPFQEEAGAVVQGTSEDRRASEPPVGERTGPAPSSLAQEEAKWTTGEARPAPCSTQGPLAQKAPCAEACLGGDAGPGLRPRAEVWGWGHTIPPQRTGARLLASCQADSGHPLCWFSPLVCVVCLFLCYFIFPDFSFPFGSHPSPNPLSCIHPFGT